MKTVKQKQQRRKRVLIVVVVVIVIAMAFAYVLPLTQWGAFGATATGTATAAAMAPAPETPPPDFGTDTGFDDSTLPAPWEEDGEGDEEEESKLPMLVITTSSPRLDVGQEVQLEWTMENFPAGTMVTWSSANPQVVGVGSDGRVVAISPGSSEVVAVAGTMRASVLVTVNALKANRIIIDIREDIIKTGDKSYELKVGDVIRLTSRISPEGAKVDKLSWKLGNGNVAEITANGRNCEFVAKAVGQTQLTVVADSLSESITISIAESGIPIATLWDYIKYGVVVVIAIVAVAVMLTWLAQRRKKEKERQKAAAAKRRKMEAERRTREREEYRDYYEPRLTPEERSTLRVSGAAVGAGFPTPRDKEEDPERPLTLDDLE